MVAHGYFRATLMFLAFIFIIGGIYMYYANFGWTLDAYPGMGLYGAAIFLVAGLVLMMRKL